MESNSQSFNLNNESRFTKVMNQDYGPLNAVVIVVV